MTIAFEPSDVREIQHAPELERFEADVGYVRPCHYETSSIHIVPFQRSSSVLKRTVASAILKEWPRESNCKTTDEVETYILKHWGAGDLLYVCADKLHDDSFIGCIAIDRKNFFPYISHLYVDDKYRRRGFSKILIEFAETVMTIQRYRESRLWCDPYLQNFYTKQGYINDGSQDGHLIMKKTLQHCADIDSMGMYGDECAWAAY